MQTHRQVEHRTLFWPLRLGEYEAGLLSVSEGGLGGDWLFHQVCTKV
jgi:hypothetical protein